VVSLLIFGSATLQDFAFAMLIGIASGTYSSIFIASPVLTAWKEREPQYIRRRQRIAEVEGGVVPPYADDIQVAKLADDDETEGAIAAPEARQAPAAQPELEAGGVATAQRPDEGGDEPDDEGPDTNGAAPPPVDTGGDPESVERRKRNDERRARRAQRRKGRRR
jgi:SecD/SecF fusion protein